MKSIVKLSEIRNYHKIWKNVKGDVRYKDWFGGKHRVYLNLIDEQPENKGVSEVQKVVSKVLADNGYTLKDYTVGVAIKPENPKNEFKVGRLLQRINPDLKNKFDSDTTREGVKLNKSGLKVVISKHPLDIMSMSTGRGWTSCMNLHSGHNRRFVAEDIKEGTLIAYLIKEGDINIKNPVARVLIKPFVNTEKDTVLVIENRVYGTDRKGFRETIESWINKFQTERKGIYNLNKSLYNDGKASVILGYGKSFSVNSVYGNFIIVYDAIGQAFGLMNKAGDLILKAEYAGISMDYGCSNFFKTVKKNNLGQNRVGGVIVAQDGSVVKTIEPIYYNLLAISENYLINISERNLYGIIDFDGNVLLETKYAQINKAGHSKNIVFIRENASKNDVKIYNVDTKEFLFDFKSENGSYINIVSYEPLLFSIIENKRNYEIAQKIINAKGEVIIDSCSSVNALDKNQLLISKNITAPNGSVVNRYQAIYDTEKMAFITDFNYTMISKIQLGLNELKQVFYRATKVVDKKKLETILDSNGKEIFADKAWDFCTHINGTSLFVVGKNGENNYKKKAEIFDALKGEIVVSADKDYNWFDVYGGNKKSGFLTTQRSDEKRRWKYGIINIKNNYEEVLPASNDLVKIYADGALYKVENLWGYVSNKGEILEAKFKTTVELKTFMKAEKERIKEEKKKIKEEKIKAKEEKKASKKVKDVEVEVEAESEPDFEFKAMDRVLRGEIRIKDMDTGEALLLIEEVKEKEHKEQIDFLTYIIDHEVDGDVPEGALQIFFEPFRKLLIEISNNC